MTDHKMAVGGGGVEGEVEWVKGFLSRHPITVPISAFVKYVVFICSTYH